MLDAIGKRYVVETGQTENGWFTRYSDGWIEQGGVTNSGASSGTVTMPISFLTEAYTVNASDLEDSSPDTGGVETSILISDRTQTSFKFSIDSRRRVSWMACGY